MDIMVVGIKQNKISAKSQVTEIGISAVGLMVAGITMYVLDWNLRTNLMKN